MVAVSSPPSSFVTDGGLPAATPLILVLKMDVIRKAGPAAVPLVTRLMGGLGGLTSKIGQSKVAQGASKFADDAMSAFNAGRAGTAGATTGATTGASSATASSAGTPTPTPTPTPRQHFNLPENYRDPVGDAGGEGAAPWMRGGAGFEEARGSQTSTIVDRAGAADRGEVAREAAKEATMQVIKPATAIGVGYTGLSALNNRKARKEQELAAEQDRIQQVSQQARSKAGTTTGQIGVSA